MICVVFLLLVLQCFLWCCGELAEIRSYQQDIDYCLKNWPACRPYTPQEIQLQNEEISRLMHAMNVQLERYDKFKNSCTEGLEIAASIKNPNEVLQFVEEYDLFEFNVNDYSAEEILSTRLKYVGVFLANSGIMSAFSGDREPGVSYYKAITEPMYYYLKGIKEELEYLGGRLGRLSPNVLESKTEHLTLKTLWTQFFRFV